MKNEMTEEASSRSRSRPLIFFSAGEPSGDLHAAQLIRELKKRYPDARFVAYGGPEMEKAGCRLDVDLTKLAIMWFGRVLWNLRTFIGYLSRAQKFFFDEKPDLVILVDYPGFNWQMAKRAKRAGIPVCYFMPPQLWGWGQWRIKKMKRYVDFVLAPLPFEEKWLKERGIDAVRIGHPFFEEIRTRSFDRQFIESLIHEKVLSDDKFSSEGKGTSREMGAVGEMASAVGKGATDESPAVGEKWGTVRLGASCGSGMSGGESSSREKTSSREKNVDALRPILTILPGSRNQEISNNLPDMLQTVKRIRAVVPNLRPMIAAFKEEQVPAIRDMMKREGVDCPVYVGQTPELMRVGVCALAVSGSVSMELLALTKPTVIYYRLGRLEHWVMRWFRRVKYITLVNLLTVDAAEGESIFYDERVRLIPARPSQREWSLMLFPEFLTEKNRSAEAALPLIEWLTNPEKLDKRRKELTDLLAREDRMGDPFQNAADEIVQRFGANLESEP